MRTLVRLFLVSMASILCLSLRPVVVYGAPCADLVITSFTVTPLQPVQGVSAHFEITVKNQGGCQAFGFVVQWKSDRNALSGPTTQVSGLAAGASTTVGFDYAFPRAGNFLTAAIVDSDKTVNESNEDNNLAILSVSVSSALPDLVVTAFTIDPDKPVEGLNAHINITVLNQGIVPAGPFTLQWKSDRNALTGPSSRINGLAAGESKTVSFDYAFPKDGNFLTVAIVDTDREVAEGNEDNNLAILSTTIQKAFVDLVLSGFQVEPVRPVQGRLAQATITVQNQGNFPSGDFIVQWKPTLLGPDLSMQVNGLAPGQTTSLTIDHTYPLAGDFFTQATVDSTNKIWESDETNNRKTMTITVEPPRPDLVITDFIFTPAEPVRGSKAIANITVKNQGNSPAGVFVLSWKPTLLTPDLSKQINGLDVGASITVDFDFTYALPGEFTTQAEVDSTHKVLELDENNNVTTRQVNVLVDTVDLLINDMAVGTGFVTNFQGDMGFGQKLKCVRETQAEAANVEPILVQGELTKICITVENQGNSPSGSFVLEWNPDALGLITPSPATLSKQVDNLDPGQSLQVIFDFTYIKAGNFHTIAKVDAFNHVKETNEANNLAILDVVVSPAGPDLVISNLTITPNDGSPLTQGKAATVLITVLNQGKGSAGPFVVEWNPDALGLLTPSPATLSTQVAGLEAGQSTEVQFQYTYPASGNFRTIANADAFKNVPETNEANNLAILNVTVGAGIDLSITNLTIDPNPPTRGSKITAHVTVLNTGFYPANNFFVQFKPNKEGIGGSSVKVETLNPGESKVVDLQATYFKAGTSTSQAIVDNFNQVVETDENNNTRELAVDVQPRKTVLRVHFTNVKISNDSEDTGDLEWLSAFLVVDSQATCKDKIKVDLQDPLGTETINIDQKGFQCRFYVDNDADPGEDLPVDQTMDVTIVESAPLIVVVSGAEVDAADWVYPATVNDIAPDLAGFAISLLPAGQQWGVGIAHTIESQKGDTDLCKSQKCFKATFTVEVVSEPSALAEGAEVEAVPSFVTLPAGLQAFVPSDAILPDGVQRIYSIYLPAILNQ